MIVAEMIVVVVAVERDAQFDSDVFVVGIEADGLEEFGPYVAVELVAVAVGAADDARDVHNLFDLIVCDYILHCETTYYFDAVIHHRKLDKIEGLELVGALDTCHGHFVDHGDSVETLFAGVVADAEFGAMPHILVAATFHSSYSVDWDTAFVWDLEDSFPCVVDSWKEFVFEVVVLGVRSPKAVHTVEVVAEHPN